MGGRCVDGVGGQDLPVGVGDEVDRKVPDEHEVKEGQEGSLRDEGAAPGGAEGGGKGEEQQAKAGRDDPKLERVERVDIPDAETVAIR